MIGIGSGVMRVSCLVLSLTSEVVQSRDLVAEDGHVVDTGEGGNQG